MKRIIILILGILIIFVSSAQAQSIWPATGLTGGATGDLDDYAVATLADGDGGYVFVISGTTTYMYWYVFDADGTDAEITPSVIRPDDYSTQGNWRLAKLTSSSFEFSKESGIAGLMGVYEANSTDTSVTGFKGADSIVDDMYYQFPDADPVVNQIWTFSTPTAGVSDVSLNYIYDAFEFVIDGGGSEITTGVKGDLEIPFGFEITRVTMLADQSTTTVIDIWMEDYATFPPDNADSITASTPPTITTATKSQDTTLTSWTTTLVSGETLRYNVDSNDNAERITISLRGYRLF